MSDKPYKQSKVGEEMENSQSKVGVNQSEERIGTSEAAKLLGVSQQAVRNAIEERRLEGHKDLQGSRVKFTTSREAIERYRERRTAVSVKRIDKEVAETFASMIAQEVGPVLQFWEQYGQRMMDTHEDHNEFLEKQGAKIDNLCETLGETNKLLRRLVEQSEQSGQTMEEIRESKDAGLEEVRTSWWRRLFRG